MPANGAADGGFQAAGRANNPAIDMIADRDMDGDAFGPAQESAAMDSGWK